MSSGESLKRYGYIIPITEEVAKSIWKSIDPKSHQRLWDGEYTLTDDQLLAFIEVAIDYPHYASASEIASFYHRHSYGSIKRRVDFWTNKARHERRL